MSPCSSIIRRSRRARTAAPTSSSRRRRSARNGCRSFRQASRATAAHRPRASVRALGRAVHRCERAASHRRDRERRRWRAALRVHWRAGSRATTAAQAHANARRIWPARRAIRGRIRSTTSSCMSTATNISLEVIGVDWGKGFAPYRRNAVSIGLRAENVYFAYTLAAPRR